MGVSRCHGATPDAAWVATQAKAEPTDTDRENAKWLLGNVIHYRSGCNHEGDDIETVAKGLAAAREMGTA